MYRTLKHALLAVLLMQSGSLIAAANDRNLPELGDRTSGIISLEAEHELGQDFLRALRAQLRTVNDPVLQDYLEHLIYSLVVHSQLEDRRLDVVLVDSNVINAFAAPGGIVGVHDGLFLYAESEHEISAILAHELAHLSQRHFARQAEAGRQAGLPSLAGLLAGIVLIAAGGGDAGVAAITAGQALSQDQMLRYSRSRESEADRVGIETLVAADMDPRAMAQMFERLERSSRFQGEGIPDFLRTHPVTRDRIADSYNQVAQYPRKQVYEKDLDYQMMRARVIVNTARNLDDVVIRMQEGINDPDPVMRAAHQYGLALAQTDARNLDEAQWQLNSLRTEYPGKISLVIAQARLYDRAERYEDAIDLLAEALAISPRNYPLTMTYADILLKAGKASKAEALLVPLTSSRPNDVNLWYLLAETYGLANNIVGVHEARAEYFVLVGNLDQAIKQLGYALPLVRDNFMESAKIRTRIEEIHKLRQRRRG